jgi:hypothetical protein
VVPCNGDIANQKIITWAEKVDTEGKRTLGILTKPDQVHEQATQRPVLSLIQGKRKDLALGYHVIRNRGADDETSTREQRELAEQVFFRNSPWNTLEPARVGVPSLRKKIAILLDGRMKDDMPAIRKDIASKLKQAQEKLADMGAARSTEQEQRSYLFAIARKFRKLTEAALGGYYTETDFSDEGLVERHDLRLATRMRELNEAFATKFYSHGHTRQFLEEAAVKSEEDGGSSDEGDLYPLSFDVPADANGELDDILADPTEWPAPLAGDIIGHISEVHRESRSWEIGTVSKQPHYALMPLAI